MEPYRYLEQVSREFDRIRTRQQAETVLEVDNLYRLYPDVVDEDNLKAALVEAALRKRA